MGICAKVFGVRDDQGRPVETGQLKELYKKSISIAWPSTVEGALLSIIGSVDTMMVGTLGSAAIAAVGLTNQPRMILLICAQALCVGTTALCARRKGAGNQAGANSCLAQSLGVVTCLGLLMMLAGYFGAEGFMKMAGANEDTLGMSVDYFRIISLGIPLNCWAMCICAALRAVGHTRITMVSNLIANLANAFLNFLLINGRLGFPALGVRGAAIATLCGAAISCGIAVGNVTYRHGYYRLSLPRFDRETLSGLTRIGSSSILEAVCLRLGFLVAARLIAGIGTAAFAAYQIANQVAGISFTLGDGIATAGTALVGQSLGARRRDLAMANVRVSRKMSVVVSLMLMVAFVLLRRPLALLFTREEEIIFNVSISFLVVASGFWAQNGRVVYSGCLRGAGDVRYVAICTLISVAILRPVLTWLFCYPMDAALPGMYLAVTGPWIAFVIDALVRDGLLYARIRRGKWLDIKLN